MLAGSELRGRRPWRPTNHASKLNKTKPVKDLSSKTKAGMELVCADNLEGHEGSHHRDHTFHHIQKKRKKSGASCHTGKLLQDVSASVTLRFHGKSLNAHFFFVAVLYLVKKKLLNNYELDF